MHTSRFHRWLTILILFAAPLSAQVHPGIGVRVRAPSVLLERFDGVYLGRRGDTLSFGNDSRGPVAIPASAITQLEVSAGRSRTHGALQGALWGGAIGLVAGLLTAAAVNVQDSLNLSDATFVAQAAVGGAEIGAIIGAIVGKRKWKSAQPRVFFNASQLGAHALDVQLAARYTR